MILKHCVLWMAKLSSERAAAIERSRQFVSLGKTDGPVLMSRQPSLCSRACAALAAHAAEAKLLL